MVINCKSFLESKRKGKSYINVKDKISLEILYTFELDYYIITKDAFENIYKNYFDNREIISLDINMPKTNILIKNEDTFLMSIDAFTSNQCKGHFHNYPIVPAVFVTNCILKEIFLFLNNLNHKEVDSVEMYLSKAMPIETKFNILVSHQNYLNNLINFKCEVKDDNQLTYGIYIINIKK